MNSKPEKTVKVAELKAKLSEFLRAARAGHGVIVCDRETPIARLVPYSPQPEPLEVRRAILARSIASRYRGRSVAASTASARCSTNASRRDDRVRRRIGGTAAPQVLGGAEPARRRWKASSSRPSRARSTSRSRVSPHPGSIGPARIAVGIRSCRALRSRLPSARIRRCRRCRPYDPASRVGTVSDAARHARCHSSLDGDELARFAQRRARHGDARQGARDGGALRGARRNRRLKQTPAVLSPPGVPCRA